MNRFDEEPTAVRCHWPDRHGPRSTDRESRHSAGSRDHDDWSDDRRHRRRRGDTRERWCCPDWEQEKSSRYAVGRWAESQHSKWQQHREERYYGQESPWDEDEYSNDPEIHLIICLQRRTGSKAQQRDRSGTEDGREREGQTLYRNR
ncbi:unnamed protein product [Callosobruchus maculatus]|uniref:Uncharacterized protein n=1 Tax=Callosobruchus maculatus TaxID=64391 RepID=A0A653CZP0_CALMS|nr:unnamed protein product [Callosobruchus maculatus]